MRIRAALAALAVAGGGIVAGQVVAAAPAAAATPPSLRVVLTSVSPAAVTPRTPLVVTGTVTNAGGIAAVAPRVSLDLRAGVLGSRADVSSWIADANGSGSTRELPGAAALPRIEPNGTASFRITVPAGGLDLPAREQDFGPRGLVVRATDAGRDVGGLRTAIVWFPVKRFSATRLSLLVPVTAAQGTDAGAATAGTAAELGPGGRLGHLIAATQDPSVAWAIDPALLSAARTLAGGDDDGDGTGGTPTPSPSVAEPTPTATPPSEADRLAGADWLARVQGGRSGRDVLALPFADADSSSLAHAGGRDLLGTADALGRAAVKQVTGGTLDSSVAWPADGDADPATFGALAVAGRSAVVLAAGNQPTAADLGHTASGRSVVPYPGGSLQGLLYDEQLSGLFAATGGMQGVAAGQQLVAELAAITMERPGDPRHLLAVAPRGWNPNPAGVRAAVGALRAVPWVSVRPLSSLRATAPAEEARGAVRYPQPARNAELPADHVREIATIRSQVLTFGKVLANPAPVVDPLLARDVSLASITWRDDPEDLAAARLPLSREAGDLTRGVHIVLGSRRPYFLASEADLPVYVANGTPYPVTVEVLLKPRSGRIRVERGVRAELAPNTRRQQVLVPVEALSSGNVQIAASVRGRDGALLGTERVLTVQVRREWETRGLIGAGAALGLLLVVGLLRGFRRDRDRVRPEDVPDLDDLASAGGGHASARLDALDPAATGELPVLRPSSLPPPDHGTNGDAPQQMGPAERPVASPDDEDVGDGPPTGEVQDARDRPVMSREQQ